MNEKTIIVTGGASGLGKETACKIAAKGHRLIIGDVNEKSMIETKSEIIQTTGNENIILLPLDLSSMESVRGFAQDVKKLGYLVDGLLCNAGVSNPVGRSKEDNIDLVFEINYLGHFLLTMLLLPQMCENGRILLIGSDMHEGLFIPLAYKPAKEVAFPDENFADNADRYNYSKLYVLYFAYELAIRLKKSGSRKIINVFNPGLMHTTNLMPDKEMFTDEFLIQMKQTNHLGNLDHNSSVVCELMTDDALGQASGQYYDRGTTTAKSSELSYVEEYRKELWELSIRLTGLDDKGFYD